MTSSVDFPCCARAARCPARSSRAKISLASARNTLPPSVSATWRLLRSSSGTPTSVFQLLDLLAEGGLRGVQPLRGASKIQLFGDRHEVTQVAQFHGTPLCEFRRATS